ncbi:transposase (plasmid) [Enterococcus faecium]|uniref:transposase n=1 Tax=Enterococcus faecium TaxID=1352 RepID=UPI0038D41A28
MKKLIKTTPNSVSRELRHTKKAFINYQSGILLALELPYLKAKIENLHTQIKALNRMTYEFINIRKIKTKIFLINHLIT